MLHLTRFFLVILVLAGVAGSASAADIRFKQIYYSTDHMVPLITYDGATVAEDLENLKAVINENVHCREECAPADGSPIAVVSLNGPGGNYSTGLDLAQFFRDNHIATVVERGNYCYSACAFAFLGGSAYSPQEGIGTYIDRVAEPGSTIGFHAPYIDDANLARYIEEKRTSEVMDSNRVNFAIMADELVRWNINPNIVGWMMFQGPDQTYNLFTPNDLYLTRTALPASPSGSWITNKEDAVRNACLRLMAAFYSTQPELEDPFFPTEFTPNTGIGPTGEPLSGFVLSNEPLRLGHCSVTQQSLATDGDFDIALYMSAGIDGRSLPLLSFFNRNKGWSTMGIGAEPTRRVFQKGSMNHMFLAPTANLDDLDDGANAFMNDSRFIPAQDVDLPIVDADMTIESQDFNTETIRAGNVRAFIQTGSRELFDAALTPQAALGTNVSHESVSGAGFIRSGTYEESGDPFSWFGFASGDTAAIVHIEKVGSDGQPWTSEEAALVRQIQCGTEFATITLNCAN